MNWKIAGIIAGILLIAGALTGLYLRIPDVHALRSQMTYLQAQLHHDQTQLTQLQARVTGQHQDLITCGDFQALINNLPQSDSNGDTIFYSGPTGTVPLPAHCINR